MSKLTVTSFKNGDVVRETSNPEISQIMVSSEEITSSQSGFINRQKRVAFIKDKTDEIKKLNIKDGMDISLAYPIYKNSKIIVKEQTIPFYEGQNPKIYPENHKYAGTIITYKGNPVYRNTEIKPESSEENDFTLQADVVEVSNTTKEIQHEEIGTTKK